MSTDHVRSLTAGSIGHQLISLAWPILCSGIVGVLDTAVNVMWVSRELGAVAVAALANANVLWIFLFAGAFGISMAGAIWVGRSLGRREIGDAKAAIGTMVGASGSVAAICVVPMLVWTHRVLRWLGTPGASLPASVEYLRILLLSVPLAYLSAAVVAALQAAGDSRTGFHLSVGVVAVDAILNPIFIKGVGPLHPLGIAGSALATLGSQAIGLTVLLWQLYRINHVLCLRSGDLRLLRIDRTRVAALLRDGGPMAIQFLWGSVEQLLMISLVNRFGANTTAAYGVAIQLWNFIMMPATAIGMAVTMIAAQNIGAGQWDRVRGSARLGLAYGVLATTMLVALAEVLARQVYEVFLPASSPALVVAIGINREATWSLIFLGVYVVWTGILRATGEVWMPLVISAGVLAVRYPITAALTSHWQASAIWLSFPASAAFASALAALYGCSRLRSRKLLSRTVRSPTMGT